MTSITASAFSWPIVQSSSWTIQAIWYSSIIVSLTSVSTATQQSVAIYRLASLPEGLQKIRQLLGRDGDATLGIVQPQLWQLYIWQIPHLMLNTSIYLFVAGLLVLLWDAAKAQAYSWATQETKVRY